MPWCTHLWETRVDPASQAKLSTGDTVESSETLMKSRWFDVEYCFTNKKGDSDILTLLNSVDCKSGSVASCAWGKGPDVHAVRR